MIPDPTQLKPGALTLGEICRARTQIEVALELKTSRGTIQRWLNGETVPSFEKILLMERLFGIKPNEWS